MKCTSYYREDATISTDEYNKLKKEILNRYPRYKLEEFTVKKQRFTGSSEVETKSGVFFSIVMKNNNEKEIYLEKKTWESDRYYKSCTRLTKMQCKMLLSGKYNWMQESKDALIAEFYLHLEYNKLKPGPVTQFKREVIYAGKKGCIIFNKEVLQEAATGNFFGEMKHAFACVPPYQVHYAYKKKAHIPAVLTELMEQQDALYEEVALAM